MLKLSTILREVADDLDKKEIQHEMFKRDRENSPYKLEPHLEQRVIEIDGELCGIRFDGKCVMLYKRRENVWCLYVSNANALWTLEAVVNRDQYVDNNPEILNKEEDNEDLPEDYEV